MEKCYLLFFVDKEIDKEKSTLQQNKYKPDGRLRGRITWAGKNKVDFNVGYRVQLDNWIAKEQMMKRNSFNPKKISASAINEEIGRLTRLVEHTFAGFALRGIVPTSEEFRKEFNSEGKEPEGASFDFFSAYKDFIETKSKKNSWSEATRKQHSSVIAHLRAFNPQLTFGDLNDKNLVKLADFLMNRASNQSEDEEQKSDLQNSTIEKIFRFLRAFLRQSIERGLCSENVLKFRPRLKTVKNQTVIYLTDEEQERLFNLSFSPSLAHLERTRDVFAFQCSTGLRYSDAINLRWSNVGEKGISMTTQKTAGGVFVPFNKKSKAIIEKYRDLKFPDEKVFPKLSNQKANDNLKDIGKMCEFERLISMPYYRDNLRIEKVDKLRDVICTHTGRKSFICTALAKGIPMHSVMKMTGHVSLRSFQYYLDAIGTDLEAQMQKFDK